MLRKLESLRALSLVSTLLLAGAMARANSVSIVGSPLKVNAANASGTSFKFHGTITPSTTMSFTVTGEAFLQTASQYGTNAAGVVTAPGKDPGEGIGTVSDVMGSNVPYGALEIMVNGFGPVAFRATAANGLGSSNPTQTLTFSATLSKLFFNFTPINNPTFTFVIADNPTTYFDNSGGFTITQGVDPADPPSSVPVPAAAWQSLLGLTGVGLIAARKRAAQFARVRV